MKLGKLILLSAVFVLMIGACQANKTDDFDDTETWEKLPFYGELRFLIVDEDTAAPISDAALQVSHLRIEEAKTDESVNSTEDGHIVIHQLMRGITYRGAGPPQPTFTFSAPHHRTKTYSVEELASGTSYDPYRSNDLPTTLFRHGDDKEIELPVYEFTIHLAPSG